jgi:hypothetical protein
MKKKNETEALNERIVLLQNKQALELKILKEQFHLTYESLKPNNLLKSTVHEVVSSPDIKDKILNNVIGLATGYLSRKVLLRASHNPIKNILGTVLQFAIANVVAKHSDTIKSTGENILQHILKYRNKVKQEF